jgi:hypothetical protein
MRRDRRSESAIRCSGNFTPSLGDDVVLTVLLLLTLTIAGWHLVGLPGVFAGVALTFLITRARLSAR